MGELCEVGGRSAICGRGGIVIPAEDVGFCAQGVVQADTVGVEMRGQGEGSGVVRQSIDTSHCGAIGDREGIHKWLESGCCRGAKAIARNLCCLRCGRYRQPKTFVGIKEETPMVTIKEPRNEDRPSDGSTKVIL